MNATRFNQEYIETNGIRLHCVKEGKGRLVILLHGFPEFWYSWRHQIPALAEGFTAIAPDLRGYNLSDKPEGVENYRMRELMEDVRGLIESQRRDRAYIVGHDWGGAVAWAFAAYHPKWVYKLVIMNAPHPVIFSRNLAGNLKQLRRSWYAFFFQLPLVPELSFRALDYRAIEEAFKGAAVRKDMFNVADIRAYKDAISRPGALTAGMNYYRATFRGLRGDNGGGRFPMIEAPTLVVWGEQDAFLGRELTYGLRRYVKDIEIKYIPRCGHWVQQEYPDLVNEYLLDFL